MNEPQEPFQAYPNAAYPARRFPWGCLLGGCAGVFLLMLGGLALTGFMGYRFYKSQLTKYTSETPVELPTLEISPERMAEIEQRVDDFQEKLENGEEVEPLVLTEADVNALISREQDLRGRVYVSIEEGQITAEVSVPTDMLPGAKGRYFNGSVVLDASLENGVLIVKADKASVNGEPIPEEFMKEIRNENLAKDAYKDPESAEWLRKFESMKVVGQTIVLTPAKPKATADETDGNSEPESGAQAELTTDAEADPDVDAASAIPPGQAGSGEAGSLGVEDSSGVR